MMGVMAKASGRPFDLEKRQAILDAAQRLFAERGLEGCPIEEIAAASQVSKVTIYRHFGEKGGIFDALVAREIDRLAAQLAEIDSDGGPIRDRLIGFGSALLAMLTAPEHLDLDIAVTLEGARNPEIARRFFEAGPGRVTSMLADVLATAAKKGEIEIEDEQLAAQDLIGLWLGFTKMKCRFLAEPPAPDEVKAHLSRTVDLFLRAVAPAE